MTTDTYFPRANETDGEMRLKHNGYIPPYYGDGSSSEMTPEQVKWWASRIASDGSEHNYARLIYDRGLRGLAASQVLAALESD